MPPPHRPPPNILIGVWALLAMGTFMRLLLVGSPLGVLDADSAVTGLMAIRMAAGEYPALFWGSGYGGTIESFLGGLLFRVLEPSTVAIMIIPMAFSAVSAVLIWRIGRRTVGEPAARLAAAFFWVWPFFYIWYSARMGPYQAALACVLLAVLMLVRIAQDREAPWWEVGFAGVAVGMAWWANPQTMTVLATTGLFLAPRILRHRAKLVWAVLGLPLGALPWLWHSVTHDWDTLDLPAPFPDNTYGDRLGDFFSQALPQALGLRSPFQHDWLFGVAGVGLFVLALASFWVFALRDRRARLLVAIAIAFPFLYSISTYTWYIDQPRYLLFLMPVVALLLGRAAGSARRAWFGIAGIGLLGVATLVVFPANPLPSADGARIPATGPLHDLLRDTGVTHAFADYWIAYRVTFEADEAIIVTPHYLVRYEPYLEEVRAAAKPAYLTIDGSDGYNRLTRALEAHSLRYEVHRRAGWAVLVPRAKVLPEEIAEVWA